MTPVVRGEHAHDPTPLEATCLTKMVFLTRARWRDTQLDSRARASAHRSEKQMQLFLHTRQRQSKECSLHPRLEPTASPRILCAHKEGAQHSHHHQRGRQVGSWISRHRGTHGSHRPGRSQPVQKAVLLGPSRRVKKTLHNRGAGMGVKAPGQADRLQHQVGAGNATCASKAPPRVGSLTPSSWISLPSPRPAAGAWLGAAMELT